MSESEIKAREGVNSYRQAVDRASTISRHLRTADSTRLAWYVAICGYMLLNSKSFFELTLRNVTPTQAGVFLFPWAITAAIHDRDAGARRIYRHKNVILIVTNHGKKPA